MEILQLAMLRPELAVLDETDSGLDIDALRIVAKGVNKLAGPGMGVLIITHYQRILHLIKPDAVHVLYDGRSSRRWLGLVEQLEEKGYGWIKGGGGGGRRHRRRGRRHGADGHHSPCPPARSRRSAPSSRSSPARSTESRSHTSTTAPPPRSRSR